MSNKDKVIEYELQIEDMLHAIQERIRELDGQKLDAFEEGRFLAFTEMMDIIKTRHEMIYAVIED